MKLRMPIWLLLISGSAVFVGIATYLFAYEFPVFSWRHLEFGPPRYVAVRAPRPEESLKRLVCSVAVEVVFVIGLLAFLRWFYGEPILPDDELLPIKGEPIKGELLLPIRGLGYSPTQKELSVSEENNVG